jgi:hypothetical protein
MATMSAARIRSLHRRHAEAHEAAYHFTTLPKSSSVAAHSLGTRPIECKPSPSADERFRLALRRELVRAGLA